MLRGIARILCSFLFARTRPLDNLLLSRENSAHTGVLASVSMSAVETGLIVFACVFGAALVGMLVRRSLSDQQLSDDAKDVIKLGLGLIATVSALVLGLLVSTAKASYDAKRAQLAQMGADLILLDRSLSLYGSETKEARSALHDLVADSIDRIDSIRGMLAKHESSRLRVGAVDFYQMVQRLSPTSEEQKSLKTEALRISIDVAQIRALALARESSSIPEPFLVVLVFWLAVLFAGFGLFAPRNLTGVTTLCICALSASAALYLILDMDEPLTGLMRVSIEPLRNALAAIGS
jgi:hypothetical protein